MGGQGGSPPNLGGLGGNPFRVFEYINLDPTVPPGLARPVGWRVGLPDGSAAWDKITTADTGWAPVGSGGGGGVVTINGLGGNPVIEVDSPHQVLSTSGSKIIIAPSNKALADAPNWKTRLIWFLDPSNTSGVASDNNTGADVAHPLLTPAELQARIWGNTVPDQGLFRIQLMSSMLAGQTLFVNVYPLGRPPTTAFAPAQFPASVVIDGYTSAAAAPVYTGTFTSPPVQVSQGNVGENHIRDTGAPAFAQTGLLYQRTNGTLSNFWPQLDQNGTATGQRRISQPTNGTNQSTLANGDSWRILQLPHIENITFPGTFNTRAYSVIGCYEGTPTSQGSQLNNSTNWQLCQFQNTLSILTCGGFYNCMDVNRRLGSAAQPLGKVVINGGLSTGAALAVPGGQNSVWIAPQANLYHSIQGFGMTADYDSAVEQARLMVFDSATAAVRTIGTNTNIDIQSIGGQGNTSDIVNVPFANAAVTLAAAPPAGMTTSATPINVRGTAVSVATFAGAGFLSDTNREMMIALA